MTKTKSNKAPRLLDSHKAFLVQRLAMYDSPREAAEALKVEHGMDITPQGAEAYDPNKRAGERLSQKWRELFEVVRKDFLANVEKYVPEANKTVRIQHLASSFRALRGRGNHVQAAEMLERIAKELGNVHSNRRELTGKDGGPVAFSELTDDQVDARLSKMMLALGIADDEGEDDAGGG